jgi:hypothetical protein
VNLDGNLPNGDSNYRRCGAELYKLAPEGISIVPSPQLSETSNLTQFETDSTNIFQPPFSQWTFALLKSSPITKFCVDFTDISYDSDEKSLILDRLADAIPNITKLYLDGARSWRDDGPHALGKSLSSNYQL